MLAAAIVNKRVKHAIWQEVKGMKKYTSSCGKMDSVETLTPSFSQFGIYTNLINTQF